MFTYQSLEEHVLRLENSDSSSGSNQQGIAARVKLGKGTFCSRVNNVIDRLTQLLISLTSVINNTTPGSEVTLGRSCDLKDSVKRNIMKLQKQIKRWEKRIIRAGVKLSPDKNKVPNMGGKEIENKKKSDKETVNVQPVTRWPGQPDKTGKFGYQAPTKVELQGPADPPCPHAECGSRNLLQPSSEHNNSDTHLSLTQWWR